MEELKPCPFCGNENVIHHTHSRQARRVAKQEGVSMPDMIVCYQCGAATSFMGSESDASMAWNRRADEIRYAENYKRIQSELLNAIHSTEEHDVGKGDELDVLTQALRSACKLIARDHDCPNILYANTLPAKCWSMCNGCEGKATRAERIERDTNCWVAFMYSCANNGIEVEV